MAGVQSVEKADQNPQAAVPDAADDYASDEDSPVEPHPLQFSWTLWHDQPSKTRSWGSGLKEIASFGTVEEFWA
jgi:hypothetical protein